MAYVDIIVPCVPFVFVVGWILTLTQEINFSNSKLSGEFLCSVHSDALVGIVVVVVVIVISAVECGTEPKLSSKSSLLDTNRELN